MLACTAPFCFTAPVITPVTIIQADLANPTHQQDVLFMTQTYTAEPTGNGSPLPDEIASRLITALRNHPTTLIFLAYSNNTVAGIATCFLGFSTFTARQLINIHDLAVRPEFKGQGISKALIQAVEAKARQLGCSRLTLEVQETNTRARKVYAAAGFEGANGGSFFCAKHL